MQVTHFVVYNVHVLQGEMHSMQTFVNTVVFVMSVELTVAGTVMPVGQGRKHLNISR